jgi:hypothetical protein
MLHIVSEAFKPSDEFRCQNRYLKSQKQNLCDELTHAICHYVLAVMVVVGTDRIKYSDVRLRQCSSVHPS